MEYFPPYLDAIRRLESVQTIYGDETIYRGEAILRFGPRLPCVVFRSASVRLCHAAHGLNMAHQDTSIWSSPPIQTLRAFLIGANQIAATSVESVGPSRLTIPGRLRNELYEMAMVRRIDLNAQVLWFRAEMHDGVMLSFGFTEGQEFFDMPGTYSASDISRARPLDKKPANPIHGLLAFTCFVDGLE